MSEDEDLKMLKEMAREIVFIYKIVGMKSNANLQDYPLITANESFPLYPPL
ncbi:MAG: hypothetical protein ABSD42_08430 [Candidatus Bathyarchaeia archaeon]|jgi:hypothetical protein